MGLLSQLFRWPKAIADISGRGGKPAPKRTAAELRRLCRFESMEDRCLLAVTPLAIGATYLEQDGGKDLHGDQFEIKFEGGATGTQLTQLIIDGDHNTPGLSVGDMIFDTVKGGLGADEASSFALVSISGGGSVTAQVTDGSSQLLLTFTGFKAGDRLVFTIDVDEVQDFDPLNTNITITNESIDPIASGVEFQGSRLTATFVASHYYDATGTATFRNVYDTLFVGTQLLRTDTNPTGLPPDDFNGQRDRSTGAVLPLTQVPIPVSISGYVYHDVNNNGVRNNGETGLANITIQVVPISTLLPQTTVTLQTDGNGFYRADKLSPGTYRVIEPSQPNGYLDGLDAAGTVNGLVIGTAVNPGDSLNDVVLLGGDNGIEYNFGEILPGALRGHVRVTDRGGDCDGPLSRPIPDVTIRLLDSTGKLLVEKKTDANGNYEFTNLLPGTYSIVEVGPTGFLDGDEHVGTVGGTVPANDIISIINLGAGQTGEEYEFCEHEAASLSGFVYHDQNNNGLKESNESPISGVTLTLRDATGNVVGTEQTGSDGSYKFSNLRAGNYRVTETHPANWLDGKDTVGTIGGATVGSVTNPGDELRNIAVQWGDSGVQYNFGELKPGSIEGFVHADTNGDCVIDPNEQRLSDVTIQLLDASGHEIATTLTDAQGHYRFDNLAPGTYAVRELQPTGFFDGDAMAGTGGGVVAINLISKIAVGSGQRLIDYNFCEIPPGSIRGMVHVDLNQNCELDPLEQPLSGVTIQLLDANGAIIATQQTDAQGRYAFENLRPGTYSVRELQPTGYFNGGQDIGSGGGDDQVENEIRAIDLNAGAVLTDYDFCEVPPSRLSGYVFQDGPAIQATDGKALTPEQLAAIRDGKQTTDDTPLAGIVLELRNGTTGEAITADLALPGYYPAGPIRTVTDAHGFYEFRGLRGGSPFGNYAVFEIQPSDYIDGIDTVGSTSGFAINPHTVTPLSILDALTVNPRNDAIVRIGLGVGASSDLNNFSEVRVALVPPPPDTPRPPTPFNTPPVPFAASPNTLPPIFRPVMPPEEMPIYGSSGVPVTWHLSVIDAGQPRGAGILPDANGIAFSQASLMLGQNWNAMQMREGRWVITADENGEEGQVATGLKHREFLFGLRQGRPVTGDFNGDGVTDFGIFLNGEWFIDINGNGAWDADDLWAKLGTENDLPVTGDWDGDGKDDIGIFGPEWNGDARAIACEPGLPDLSNRLKEKPKNLPPKREEATNGHRLLRLSQQGRPRADLIDHVFRFGKSGDTPITGDWDGDGVDSIGIFRDGEWLLDMNGDGHGVQEGEGRDLVAQFGQPGDIPIVGDFDGDGIDEIGVFRDGKWFVDTNHNHELDATDRVFELGARGDQPIVGDWNGDGVDEPGLYRDTEPPPETQARR